MKTLKKVLLFAFLGVMSFNMSATECDCHDYPLFNSNVLIPYQYGINQSNFTGGFSFSMCDAGASYVTFTWDFGDGNTQTYVDNGTYSAANGLTFSTGVNHNYTTGGTYNVCLKIEYYYQHPMSGAVDKCSRTICETITVEHPCDGNIADFHILDYPDSKKRFIDISRTNDAFDIVAQTWNIDGQIFTGSFVDYVFTPGSYDVCLEVVFINRSTGDCCIRETCSSILVEGEQGECSLDPGFSFSCFTDDCIFKFSGSAGSSNRNIKSWSWDFGDGRTGQGQNIFHTYENPGTYEICLTIVGENGGECCFEEFCRTIDFDCQGIDLLSLPDCDNGSQGGGGASSRVKAPQYETENSLNAYPNPSSGNINLEIGTDQDQQVRIELIDINGKRIPLVNGLPINKGQSKQELNIDEVATGVYTLSVTGETFFKTKVIVIE